MFELCKPNHISGGGVRVCVCGVFVGVCGCMGGCVVDEAGALRVFELCKHNHIVGGGVV